MPTRDADQQLLDDLVAANHILYERGVVDAFGHVSVRHDADPQRFILARNMAPARVRRKDLMTFTLDGTPVDDDRKPYLERFIHGSIYKARPDVNAVVHSHSVAVVPFSVASGVTLRPVGHMSSFLVAGVPRWEIRDAEGEDNDMLVRSEATADHLARALGDAPVILMRGHGSVAVGPDVQTAVFRAVYTEVNARLQAEALRLSPEITYIGEREGRNSTRSNEGQIPRAWALWKELAAERLSGR